MRLYALIVCSSIITGCATHGQKPSTQSAIITPPLNIENTDSTTNTPSLPLASQWTASGKFSVRVVQSDGKKKGGSVYFVWQQQQQNYQVILTGPLGQGRTTLTGTPQQVTLQSAKTGEIHAATPEDLITQALDWYAPVSYLRYWLEGKAATSTAITQYNEQGLLQQLIEGDWQANFSQYQQHQDNPPKAYKIIITGPQTSMTVLINDFNYSNQQDSL